MAMIFGLYQHQATEVKRALHDLCHDNDSRCFQGAEILFYFALQEEPYAHFRTFRRAVQELAKEAVFLADLTTMQASNSNGRIDAFFRYWTKADNAGSAGSQKKQHCTLNEVNDLHFQNPQLLSESRIAHNR